MADWNVQATWDAAYNIGYNGQRFGYSRAGMIRAANSDTPDLDFYINRAQQLVNRHNLTPNTDVLVVGCGLGFFVEVLVDFGADAYGIDISTLMVSRIPTESRSDIATRCSVGDILAPDIVQTVKTLKGGSGTSSVVISEDLLSALDPTEYTSFFNNCESLTKRNGQIFHLVSTAKIDPDTQQKYPIPQTRLDLSVQWRTLDEWASMTPVGHTLVSVHTFDSLEGTAP